MCMTKVKLPQAPCRDYVCRSGGKGHLFLIAALCEVNGDLHALPALLP